MIQFPAPIAIANVAADGSIRYAYQCTVIADGLGVYRVITDNQVSKNECVVLVTCADPTNGDENRAFYDYANSTDEAKVVNTFGHNGEFFGPFNVAFQIAIFIGGTAE